MSKQPYRDAASAILAAGQIPVPVSDTLINILQVMMTEEQAEFVKLFDRPLNRDEVREKSGLDDTRLDTMLSDLMNNGVITGIPGKTTGIIVYRVLPIIPGLFEYSMMRGKTGEKEKKLARLFEQLFDELADMVQKNYDTVVPAFKSFPPLTRVVPVEKEIDRTFDTVMPSEDVKKIVDHFEVIAVAHCYCRHQKDLLNRPCSVTDERKNCLLFGRSAQFAIDYNFGEEISRERAKDILEESEKAGLVHRAFHEKSDPGREEMAICNCCKCCCETFQVYYRGASPQVTYASYRAAVDDSSCTACGVCVDMCPMEAIEMSDDVAVVDGGRCIGCGVCAYHCSSEAVRLERTGQREVFVPPPKLSAEK